MLCVLQVRNEFYKDSQGVILVYDVGLRESFDALDSWLTEMKQEMGSQANMENIIFIVCANKVPLVFKYLLWYLIYMWEIAIKCGLWPIKVDLTKRRVVDESEGRLWAESRGFHYFETSAQSGEGINEMFQVCTRIHLFSFDYPAVLFFKEWLFFLSLFMMCPPPQAFFSSITDMCENGGKRPTPEVNVGFTKEQADTIRRIRNSKDSWDMLGVKPGATR